LKGKGGARCNHDTQTKKGLTSKGGKGGTAPLLLYLKEREFKKKKNSNLNLFCAIRKGGERRVYRAQNLGRHAKESSIHQKIDSSNAYKLFW